MDPDQTRSRLSLLGPVRLSRADGSEARSVLAQPKRVALLAYLRLAGGGRPLARDTVLGTFWPEIPEERALSSLRQAVHFLRRSLGDGIVERSSDHLLSVPAEEIWCDVEELERRVESGAHGEALELYAGPFLDGLPVDGPPALEEWIEGMRRHCHRLALRAATGAADSALQAGRLVEAVERARELIAMDPLEERGVALLVEAHAADGDAVAALRAYEEYAERLARELDLRPSSALRDRIQGLRRGHPEPHSPDLGESLPAPLPGPGAQPVAQPPSTAEASQSTSREPAPDGGDHDDSGVEPGPASRGPGRERSWHADRTGTRRSIRGLPTVTLALTAAAAAAFLTTWLAGRDASTASALLDRFQSADRPSVAVLPFTNLSGDSASAFFVSGVHESVVLTLSEIGALDVSGLQAVRAYASTTASYDRIAEELGVSALMSGSVQRAGDRVRIIVELVDAERGTQLWADSFDRRIDDIFGVQSEIARSVASSLSAALTPGEADRIDRRPTESVVALERYMRGREAYERPSLDGMDDAIRSFEAAVAADSAFAPAWAGIADALLQRVQFYGYPLTWADSALLLAEHALRLDPQLPEAHKTLGFVHSVFGRERAALASNLRALELRPAFAEALNNAAWSQYYLGDVAGAERLITRAFRLQPTIPQLRSNVGAIWAALGRVEEAERWLDAVLDTDPGFTAARNWRVFLDHERGDPERAHRRATEYTGGGEPESASRARAAYAALLARDFEAVRSYARDEALATTGADPFTPRRIETILGMGLMEAGATDEGRRLVRTGIQAVNRAQGNGADGWDPPWELAAAYGVLGEETEALRHLTDAVDRGFPHASLMRLDPAFDGVRSLPAFPELVRRVETRADEQRRTSLARGR